MQYQYFKTIADLKLAGVRVTADVQLAELQPYFFRAEQNSLLPIIGPATLDQLHTDEPADLLELVRPVLAGYAVKAFASVTQRTNTPNGTAPVAGTKENANTDKLITQHLAALDASATEALEPVLRYLEQHPDEFSAWHRSPYATVYPRRYFQNLEQLQQYANAPASRPAFRKAQGALLALTAQRILPAIGAELNARLVAELDAPEHEQVLSYIRTALAIYLAPGDHEQLHAADCALVELRQLLQRSLDDYPEYLSSPSYIPTDLAPLTTANAYCGF